MSRFRVAVRRAAGRLISRLAPPLRCVGCGRGHAAGIRLIAGPGLYVCSECVNAEIPRMELRTAPLEFGSADGAVRHDCHRGSCRSTVRSRARVVGRLLPHSSEVARVPVPLRNVSLQRTTLKQRVDHRVIEDRRRRLVAGRRVPAHGESQCGELPQPIRGRRVGCRDSRSAPSVHHGIHVAVRSHRRSVDALRRSSAPCALTTRRGGW